MTMDEEFLKMETAFQVIDTFREAVLLVQNQQKEIKAIIYSRIGYVYDQVMLYSGPDKLIQENYYET